MTDPYKLTTLRTTPADRENIQRIIESGLATNMTSAVQLSLALVAHQIVKAKPLRRQP